MANHESEPKKEKPAVPEFLKNIAFIGAVLVGANVVLHHLGIFKHHKH